MNRMESTKGMNIPILLLLLVASVRSQYRCNRLNGTECRGNTEIIVLCYGSIDMNNYDNYCERNYRYQGEYSYDIKLENASETYRPYKESYRYSRIRSVNAAHNSLSEIPAEIFACTNLRRLEFSHNNLNSWSVNDFANNPELEYLDLSHNTISIISFTSTGLFTLKTLHTLDLSQNEIELIPEGIFLHFPNIKKLNLANNMISALELTTFEGLTVISELNLSHNNISSLNLSLFRFVTLNTLYLNNNQMFEIEKNDFKSLKMVKILTLQENYLRSFDDKEVFKFLVEIEELYVSNNLILSVKNTSFTENTKLTILDLSNNLINYMAPDAFASNKQLKILNLEGNNINGTLQRDQFSGLSQVQLLNLSNHQLSHIEDFAFSGMYSLTILNISKNNICSIALKAFDNLNKLTELDLSYNSLTEISFDTGDLISLSWISVRCNRLRHLSLAFTENLAMLQYLDISNNNIAHIHNNTFAFMINLRQLQLHSNPISGIISKLTFSNLQSLPELDLSGTNLTGISNDSFSEMKNCVLLDISFSNLTFIGYEAFRNTNILRVIDLSNNNLTLFLVNTSSLTYLRELNLAHNDIEQITPFTFDQLISLEVLRLQYNNLHVIHHDSFKTLTSITYIDISYNGNVKMNLSCFEKTKNLSQLVLSGNKESVSFTSRILNLQQLILAFANVKSVESLSLYYVTSIDYIDLERNEIVVIDYNSFTNLTELKTLDLHSNKISTITPGSFRDLKSLKDLDLSRNNISNIGFGLLFGLSNLHVLNISYNKIHTIDANRMHNMPLLQTLLIDGNLITNIDVGKFSKTRIKEVSLGENPLSCYILIEHKSKIFLRQINKTVYYPPLLEHEKTFVLTALSTDYNHENVEGITCVGSIGTSLQQSSNYSRKNLDEKLTGKFLEKIEVMLASSLDKLSTRTQDATVENLLGNITKIIDYVFNNIVSANQNMTMISENMLNSFQNISTESTKVATTNNEVVANLIKDYIKVFRDIMKDIQITQKNIYEEIKAGADIEKHFLNISMTRKEISNNSNPIKYNLSHAESKDVQDKIKELIEMEVKKQVSNMNILKDPSNAAKSEFLQTEKKNDKTNIEKSSPSVFTEVCVALTLTILLTSAAYLLYIYKLKNKRYTLESTSSISREIITNSEIL